MRTWLCVLLLMSLRLAAPAQAPARLTFDVASIRPADPNAQGGGIKATPGGQGYTAQNISVKLIFSLMYKVPMRQINGPAWMDSEKWNIEARADKPYNIDDLHTMVQNLLTDRFGLKYHIETRQGPVYTMTIDKAGLKMTRDETPQDFAIPVIPESIGVVTGTRVPMVYLSWYLGQLMQTSKRPVVDRTGLTGFWDFHLSFLPELPPDFAIDSLSPEVRDRPSVLEAARQQLGLKLTAEEGPVQYYIVDHLEHPSAN